MLSQRLKELRLEHGYTMKRVAEFVHVTEASISLYEAGKREPSYSVLIALADLFDVTTDFLLGRES
jgi:transcriptional regulator with XRE-family HTH domain